MLRACRPRCARTLRYGQLGLGHHRIMRTPSRVALPRGLHLRRAVCGYHHTLVEGTTRKEGSVVLAFGSGGTGALGLGRATRYTYSPRRVVALDGRWYRVAAGPKAECSFAWYDSRSAWDRRCWVLLMR